jgi:hypothetical protein
MTEKLELVVDGESALAMADSIGEKEKRVERTTSTSSWFFSFLQDTSWSAPWSKETDARYCSATESIRADVISASLISLAEVDVQHSTGSSKQRFLKGNDPRRGARRCDREWRTFRPSSAVSGEGEDDAVSCRHGELGKGGQDMMFIVCRRKMNYTKFTMAESMASGW